MPAFGNYSGLIVYICRQNMQLSRGTVRGLCTSATFTKTSTILNGNTHKVLSKPHLMCASSRVPLILETVRFKSDSEQNSERNRSVVETDPNDRPFSELSTAQKVGRVGKDSMLGLIVIFGLTVTGGMFYFIYKEFFSRESDYGIYNEAMDICLKDSRVQDALGKPLKAFGETSSRGRRRHIRHTTYQYQGREHMRLQFYMKGKREKATVHVEVRKNDQNKYEYRYLFLQTDGFPRQIITIYDNRSQQQTTGQALQGDGIFKI